MNPTWRKTISICKKDRSGIISPFRQDKGCSSADIRVLCKNADWKKAGPSLNNKIEVETFVVAKKANLDECSRQSVNEQLNIFFFEGTNVSFAESFLLTDFSAYFPPFIVVCLILCKLSFILSLNFFFCYWQFNYSREHPCEGKIRLKVTRVMEGNDSVRVDGTQLECQRFDKRKMSMEISSFASGSIPCSLFFWSGYSVIQPTKH